jgi:hypothetical protein
MVHAVHFVPGPFAREVEWLMVLPLVARVPAVAWKNLRQKPQQKYPHQDPHIRRQHSSVTHRAPRSFPPGKLRFQGSGVSDQGSVLSVVRNLDASASA